MNSLSLLVLLLVLTIGVGCSNESPAPQVLNELNSQAPQLEENSDTETPSLGAATPPGSNETTDGSTESDPDENTSEPPVDNMSSNAMPNISFQGTSLGGGFEVGDTILLDASYSTVEGDDIVSFQWEQIDNGNPSVEVINANTATASFPATAEIDGARLNFQVSVVTAGGNIKTASLFYTWDIVVPELVGPVEAQLIGDGYYVTGQAGEFYALSAESLFVANQVDFTIDHVNPVTNTVLNSYQLTAMPTILEYVEPTNSLYVGLAAAEDMIRINLDTGLQTAISTYGEILSIAARDDRVYFTIEQGIYKWALGSVGNDDISRGHGIVDGDLIMPNPVTDEIVATWTGVSPASVYRYTFDASGNVVEAQMSRDLGSNARDLAISKDGLRLAVMAGGGNGSGYTIYDIDAADLSVSSGAWDTGAYPVSGDFSDSGLLFVASDTTDIMVFDAFNHTLTVRHDVNEGLCGLGYNDLTDVLFSEDDQHHFARLDCGFDNEKTVFFYHRVP